MRKILLGTTAVVSAAFGAAVITPAAAQDAPTVRIGGSIQAYYGYINADGQSSNPGGTGDFGRIANSTVDAATGRGGYTNVTALTTNNTIPGFAAGGTNGIPTSAQATPAAGSAGNFARSGKSDFMTLPGISVIVSGKSAQGFTYGGQIDLEFNALEGNLSGGNRSSVQRSTAVVGEAHVFVAHQRFGQIRMGDEDGVMGGLMNSGFVTNFGTGGVYGVWEQFQIRQSGNRTQTGPGQLGDNTKVVYMSPQFYLRLRRELCGERRWLRPDRLPVWLRDLWLRPRLCLPWRHRLGRVPGWLDGPNGPPQRAPSRPPLPRQLLRRGRRRHRWLHRCQHRP